MAGRSTVFRAPGVAAGGESEEGVDRGLKRTGVLLNLGEQKAALEDGEQGYGVVVTASILAARWQAAWSFRAPSLMAADHCWKPAVIRARARGSFSARNPCPASEPSGSRRAAGCLGLGDDGVAPGPQAAGGAEVGLPRLPAMVRAWWSMTACTRSSLSGK